MEKAPSFKPFTSSSTRASRHLSRIKSSDNRGERTLRSALWRKGFRFRKNVRDLPGKPDIVFAKQRVVVFCDGDFWHGRNWRKDKDRLSAGPNASYWLTKIQSNMNRDKRRNEELAQLGWKVVRVWDSDVQTNPTEATRKVIDALRRKHR
jgi:DNA mismatch endonuclease (patch repair protein)